MTLYVTNLSTRIERDALTALFAQFGRVAGVDIWEGHNGDDGRRAAVVEMHDGGEHAMRTLHGKKFRGRAVTVSESRPWDPA